MLPLVCVEHIDTLILDDCTISTASKRSTLKLALCINIYCHGTELCILHREENSVTLGLKLLCFIDIRPEPELYCIQLCLFDLNIHAEASTLASIEVHLAGLRVRTRDSIPLSTLRFKLT